MRLGRLFPPFILASAALVLAQGTGLPEEVAGYLSWTRANAQKSFEESAHPVAKDIYFNEVAAQGFDGSSFSFPHAEGSVFVKERMDPEALSVTTLYAMRKVAGFDPENGNWQYAVFERGEDGTFGGGWMSAEGAAMCVECHRGAADKDYTFLSYLSGTE